MCPTLEQNGVTIEYYKSGNCKVTGPVQHIRLNIRGAIMATHQGIQFGEEFQMGDLVTCFWGCLAPGIAILLFGENTLLNVDVSRDDWFLEVDKDQHTRYRVSS